MKLQPTTIYKVTVKTANSNQAVLRLTFKPSIELIVLTLLALKAQVALDADNALRNQTVTNDDYTRLERLQKRYDDLIELVDRASIKIPAPENNKTTEVRIAGVFIGSINVHASTAWELR